MLEARMSSPDPRPHLGGDYSGIDPGLMDLFEPALGRTGATIESSEPQIRRTLQQFDLDTSYLTAFREAANWISAKRPELRRRKETISAEKADWGAPGQAVNGMVAFDEARYSKTFNDPDVYAAVSHLSADGKISDSALAALEKRAQDPEFATKLMHALGPETYLALMRRTVSQRDEKRLEAALSKALGAASPRLGADWRKSLTADLDREEYFALARALKHGTFDHGFLLYVARKVDSASRAEKDPWFAGRQVRTPLPEAMYQSAMKDVFEALGRHPKAAQEFFAYDRSALRFYVMEKPLKDGGVALGRALEAATMTYRDHAGTALDPSRGYLSAGLASDLVHLQFERIKADERPSLVAAGSIGRILAAYISDVNRVAFVGLEQPGVFMEDYPNLPGREDWGARFNKGELRAVMQEAFKEDEKAFGVVTSAQTAWSDRLLNHGAGQVAAGQGADSLNTAGLEIGAGFGLITDAAGLARIEKGHELDETQKRNMKILMAVVNTGLAIPQAGSWPIGASVTGAWTGMIEDAVQGNARKEAVFAANSTVEQTRFLVHQLTAQAMFDHGLFGAADPPAKTHPWASLSDVEPGDDPRSAPNNFLKPDGKTLMSFDEMSAGDGRRYDAYHTWLYKRPEDNPWKTLGVQTALDDGYTTGFVRYQ
ncbi:hypothetical protein AB0K05_02600 [Nonomuraea sp. NPDC049486]|uniref:hypothetical protein n=1 Tax=Nonomuraea sp. NPDC049486 TaxID=3155773 RepID=UPI00342712DC